MPNRGNFPLQPDNPEEVNRTALVSGRQSGPSTAPMPNARPWRRGQAPEPRSGVPKAQGWTATPAVAAQLSGPSVAAEHAVDSTGDIVPKRASATPRFHTTLTGTTNVSGLSRVGRGCDQAMMGSARAVPNKLGMGSKPAFFEQAYGTRIDCRLIISQPRKLTSGGPQPYAGSRRS